jgi:hypothetical protein
MRARESDESSRHRYTAQETSCHQEQEEGNHPHCHQQKQQQQQQQQQRRNGGRLWQLPDSSIQDYAKGLEESPVKEQLVKADYWQRPLPDTRGDPAPSDKAAQDYLASAANIATSPITQMMDPKNPSCFVEAMHCAGLNDQLESGAPGFLANKSVFAAMEANKNAMLEQAFKKLESHADVEDFNFHLPSIQLSNDMAEPSKEQNDGGEHSYLDAAAVMCQVEVDSDDKSRSQGSLVDKEESAGNDTGEYVVSDGKEDDDKNEDQEDDKGDLSVGIMLSDAFQAHLGALKAKSKKKAIKANNTTAPSSSPITKALREVLVATLKSFRKGRQQRPFLAALYSP